MTMNTKVHIAKPINPKALFLHVLAVLESDSQFVPAWEKPADAAGWGNPSPGPLTLTKATYRSVRQGDSKTYPNGEIMANATTGEPFTYSDSGYCTTLGQGLACIWEVEYGEDGPMDWRHNCADWGCSEPCEGDLDYGNTVPIYAEGFASANFDTAYGYRNARGGGCGDLHAFILTVIGQYLHSVGCDEWIWSHEEQGTWHGPSEIERRGDPMLGAFA